MRMHGLLTMTVCTEVNVFMPTHPVIINKCAAWINNQSMHCRQYNSLSYAANMAKKKKKQKKLYNEVKKISF